MRKSIVLAEYKFFLFLVLLAFKRIYAAFDFHKTNTIHSIY